MRYTVMVVEPNLDERKEIICTLIHAGYDALPVDPGAVLGKLYRLNYEMGFDDTVQAVILSDNVPTDYVRALYRCLAEMTWAKKCKRGRPPTPKADTNSPTCDLGHTPYARYGQRDTSTAVRRWGALLVTHPQTVVME